LASLNAAIHHVIPSCEPTGAHKDRITLHFGDGHWTDEQHDHESDHIRDLDPRRYRQYLHCASIAEVPTLSSRRSAGLLADQLDAVAVGIAVEADAVALGAVAGAVGGLFGLDAVRGELLDRGVEVVD
jgi:hypothetical protein